MTSFVVGTLLVLVLLAWGTYRSAQILRRMVIDFNLLLLPSENLARLVLIGICIGLGIASGLPNRELGWDLINPARDFVLGLVIGGAVAATVPPMTHFAVARLGTHIYSPLVVQSILPRTKREWAIVPLALVPAVLLEELLFRSLLLGGFQTMFSPLLLSVAWSAVFGWMHLPQGSLGVAVAFALGLVLSTLFLATSSLLAPFVAHYLINLIQLGWAFNDRSWLESLPSARSHT